MTPTPKENKTLADFFEREDNRFTEQFGAPVGDGATVKLTKGSDTMLISAKELKEFRDAHDTRLLEFVREMINGEGFKNPSEAGQFALHADGYNQAIEDIIDLLTPPTKV